MRWIYEIKWVKVFKNCPSKIYGREPLKNFTWSILEYLDPSKGLSMVRFITDFFFNILVQSSKIL